MEIKLYKNSSDRNMVSKSLEFISAITVNSHIEKPLIDMSISLPKSAISFTDFANYVEIIDFNRKYFITDVKKDIGGLVTIFLHEDLLSSHFDKIKNISAIIGRQEKAYNLYVPDGNIPMQSKKNVVTKRFPNSLSSSTGAMILITQGGEYFIKDSEEGGTENGQ